MLMIRCGMTVVEGVWMKEPWVLKNEMVGDAEYLTLLRSDRRFVRSLRLDVQQRAPWSENAFLDKLAKLRDDAIVKQIKYGNYEADPMADVGDADTKDKTIRSRYKVFHGAGIAHTIAFAYPPFTTPDGTQHDAVGLPVISTACRSSPLTVKIR